MHLPHASVTQPTWSLCCCLVARSRRAGGFTLHCIDTPSLLDQDNVSDAVRAGWQLEEANHSWLQLQLTLFGGC